MSLIAEAPGYLQVFSDGSVKRFAPDISSPSEEPIRGCKTKDVIIDSSKPITARLFLPECHNSSPQLLPVLVYFHGGGFCVGSTTWLGYDVFLRDLSAVSQCIVLSVDYRLAPEYPLPTAYEDCYTSLDWLIDHVSSEPWLNRADLSRVFLSGDSAGGNITHNVAVKFIQNGLSQLKIKRLLFIHPFFGSEKRTPKEMADEEAYSVVMNDMFWRLSIPEGSNHDYFGCNFEKTKLSHVEWFQFPAVVVFVAGMDFLKERGVMYEDFLKKKMVKEVKLVEAEGECHVFHVFHPKSEAAGLLQRQMSEFLNNH